MNATLEPEERSASVRTSERSNSRPACGDGIVQTPNGNNQNEGCDDGNKNDNDFCSNLCQFNPG